MIPSIAIKRVEVLRDGAAAQYGSDAIAGVINFITKDASEGGEFMLQYGEHYEGEQSLKFAANAGFGFGDTGFLNLSVEYTDNDALSRGIQRVSDEARLLAAGVPLQVIGADAPFGDSPFLQTWGRPETSGTRLFLNFGVDFTGGTLVEVGYAQPVELESIRSALAASEFGEATVQAFGSASDVLIRIAPKQGSNTADISGAILELLQAGDQSVEMRRVEFVGPQVGEELTEDGGLAMIYALLGILIYVALRFQMRFSVGAIAALVHDVVITIGIFSILQLDFDLTVLAALLAVIGYSLNDTIVVFDRIRENFHKMRKVAPIKVMNTSLNQTLSRTIMTSVTTLLVLTALFLVGGEIIHGFSTALIIGVLIGTYSSIFVASPVTLALGITKEDLMPVEKEGADQQSHI